MTLQTIDVKIFNKAKKLMGKKFPLMIEYFTEDTKIYVDEIEKSYKEKRLDLAVRAAHTIKSSAGQLGAKKLSDIAKEIEVLCGALGENKSDDYERLFTLYKQLKSEFSEVLSVFKSL
jgi:HPt (histidine-containing phosphotransfer) domain-containing protein